MIKTTYRPNARTTLLFVVFLTVVFGGYWLDHHVAAIEDWIQGLGHWANLGFILIFTLTTPIFVSVDLLCIIAGALFSLPSAIFDVLAGTMLASAVIFVTGRHLARQPIERILDQHPKLDAVNQLIGNGGMKILFLIRLLPLPFALTSYTFSVSRVRFVEYWLSTSGIFFYNAAITYFGFLAGHLSKQMSQGEHYSGPSNSILLLGIAFCIGVLVLLARIAKAELDRLKDSNPQKPPSIF